MLQLDHIYKAYEGADVLRGVSLRIQQGERFVLLGPSGCGKTTLLRLIAGFETPDSGNVTIDGQEVGALPVEQRPVGYIFQRHALFPHLNVFDNIAVGPRIRGLSEKEISEQVSALLKLIRLEGRNSAWPHQLSGGESQRVALARAVINRPKLLLLDEPLSALDESLRQNLREELIELQQAFGITFLFVTHDREEAMMLAHRMAVLHEGRSLQAGTPDDLYARPEHPAVARFLGDINCLTGAHATSGKGQFTFTTHAGDVLQGKGVIPSSPDGTLHCYIRPESFFFIGDATTLPINVLEGKIQSRTLLGRNIRYQIVLATGTLIELVQTYLPPHENLPAGTAVRVGVDEQALRLFAPEVL